MERRRGQVSSVARSGWQEAARSISYIDPLVQNSAGWGGGARVYAVLAYVRGEGG